MPTLSNNVTGTDNAVVGVATGGRGVEGWSDAQYGVAGESKQSAGVRGTSAQGRGVEGWSDNNWGVGGFSKKSVGVHGQSDSAPGVIGKSTNGRGVEGWSDTQFGVAGESKQSDGVFGTSATGVAVHGKGGRLAGLFEGNVEITGGLNVAGLDIASVVVQLTNNVAQLTARLNSIPGAGTGTPTTGTTAVLSSSLTIAPGQNSYEARVSGPGFQAGENVVVAASVDGAQYVPWTTTAANGQGVIDVKFTITGATPKKRYDIHASGQSSNAKGDTFFSI
jgi:hypothetical protein